MTATLENHEALYRVEAGIESNRQQAGDLVPAVLANDIEAAARMVVLNAAWVDLTQVRYDLTGVDEFPFRMIRR